MTGPTPEDHARLWVRYHDVVDDRSRLESENHDLREMLRRAGDQIETDWHITPGTCDCEPWDRRHHPALDEIRAYFATTAEPNKTGKNIVTESE